MVYRPTNFIGGTQEEFQAWVRNELERLSLDLNETIALDLRPVYRAPDKPREGMIISADGTSFNPGAGAGAYERKGGAWVKL